MSDKVEEFLLHYGVVGMKWGKRHSKTRNYTARDRRRDTANYGSRGTRRIEEHVKGGRTIGQSRRKEFRRQAGTITAIAAVGLGAAVIPGLLQQGAQLKYNKSQVKAEDWANLQKILDKTAITSYKTLVL